MAHVSVVMGVCGRDANTGCALAWLGDASLAGFLLSCIAEQIWKTLPNEADLSIQMGDNSSCSG